MFGNLAEGGSFETMLISVYGTRDGLLKSLDIFDDGDVDHALAWFEALQRDDPLWIPPNTATHAIDGARAAARARDWDLFRSLHAPEFVFDDRRTGVRLTYGLDQHIDSVRVTRSDVPERTRFAVSPDRVALERCRYGATGESRWEVETLEVKEIDQAGRLLAIVAFDGDDLPAAGREFMQRSAGIEQPALPPALYDVLLSTNEDGLDAAHRAFHEDLVLRDHRRTGLGSVEGRDTYLSALEALFAETDDVVGIVRYFLQTNDRGALGLVTNVGTTGGGPFETTYVAVAIFGDDRLTHVEWFEPEDVDAARARFEELTGRQ
jgi:hypothetical protein